MSSRHVSRSRNWDSGKRKSVLNQHLSHLESLDDILITIPPFFPTQKVGSTSLWLVFFACGFEIMEIFQISAKKSKARWTDLQGVDQQVWRYRGSFGLFPRTKNEQKTKGCLNSSVRSFLFFLVSYSGRFSLKEARDLDTREEIDSSWTGFQLLGHMLRTTSWFIALPTICGSFKTERNHFGLPTSLIHDIWRYLASIHLCFTFHRNSKQHQPNMSADAAGKCDCRQVRWTQLRTANNV